MWSPACDHRSKQLEWQTPLLNIVIERTCDLFQVLCGELMCSFSIYAASSSLGIWSAFRWLTWDQIHSLKPQTSKMRFDIKTTWILILFRSKLCDPNIISDLKTSLGSTQKIADDHATGRLTNATSYATSCVWNLSKPERHNRQTLALHKSFIHFLPFLSTAAKNASVTLERKPVFVSISTHKWGAWISKFFRKYFGFAASARDFTRRVSLWSSRSNYGTGFSMGHRWSGRLYG